MMDGILSKSENTGSRTMSRKAPRDPWRIHGSECRRKIKFRMDSARTVEEEKTSSSPFLRQRFCAESAGFFPDLRRRNGAPIPVSYLLASGSPDTSSIHNRSQAVSTVPCFQERPGNTGEVFILRDALSRLRRGILSLLNVNRFDLKCDFIK
jgi:hypothetical protein